MDKASLIKIGTCCGLGCKQCPYEPKHEKGSILLSKESIGKLKIYDEKKPEDEYLGAKFRPKYEPACPSKKVYFYLECTYYNEKNPIDNVYTMRILN